MSFEPIFFCKFFAYAKTRLSHDAAHFMVLLLVTAIENIDYTLNQIFCRKQSFVYLQFYLYCKGKIVNKQRIVCDRISGSRYTNSANNIVGVRNKVH